MIRPGAAVGDIRRLSALAAAVLAAVVTGCGGSGDESASSPKRDAEGPVHVHGLGINPADDSLFIATHTGLFRAAPDKEVSTRVADRYQDTMGFTVVGPDHFLGSGHPDPREQLPPLLGLIVSRDGGESWNPVALLGEADFHALESQGRTVYGYDASGGRFMASRDGGRNWSERAAPEPLVDLAVNPGDRKHVVASGEASIHVSRDGGRRWRSLAEGAGYLAWPSAKRLYRAAPDGGIHVSSDGGHSWREAGSIEGQPAAFEAAKPREIYVALHDGTIQRSADGGESWAIRSRP